MNTTDSIMLQDIMGKKERSAFKVHIEKHQEYLAKMGYEGHKDGICPKTEKPYKLIPESSPGSGFLPGVGYNTSESMKCSECGFILE